MASKSPASTALIAVGSTPNNSVPAPPPFFASAILLEMLDVCEGGCRCDWRTSSKSSSVTGVLRSRRIPIKSRPMFEDVLMFQLRPKLCVCMSFVHSMSLADLSRSVGRLPPHSTRHCKMQHYKSDKLMRMVKSEVSRRAKTQRHCVKHGTPKVAFQNLAEPIWLCLFTASTSNALLALLCRLESLA